MGMHAGATGFSSSQNHNSERIGQQHVKAQSDGGSIDGGCTHQVRSMRGGGGGGVQQICL